MRPFTRFEAFQQRLYAFLACQVLARVAPRDRLQEPTLLDELARPLGGWGALRSLHERDHSMAELAKGALRRSGDGVDLAQAVKGLPHRHPFVAGEGGDARLRFGADAAAGRVDNAKQTPVVMRVGGDLQVRQEGAYLLLRLRARIQDGRDALLLKVSRDWEKLLGPTGQHQDVFVREGALFAEPLDPLRDGPALFIRRVGLDEGGGRAAGGRGSSVPLFLLFPSGAGRRCADDCLEAPVVTGQILG